MKTTRTINAISKTGQAGGIMLITLTPAQTERIARGAALPDVLSKKCLSVISPYLSDPDYFVTLNRLKKNPAVVLIQLTAPNAETTLSSKAYRMMERLAHNSGMTINRFINIAIAEKLAALKGGK
jgi:hypothetical protein